MADDLHHVGFTGTREGMTPRQRASFEYWLGQRPAGVLHHGRCKGADEQANNLALARGWVTVAHPGHLYRWISECECTTVLPARATLVRNMDIVNQTDELVATPKQFEMLRKGSGTWYTILFAKKKGKPVTIIYPDGGIGPR